MPFYGQNNVSGVHPGSTANTSMRLELPYSYNTNQGIQHFRVAPSFTWVPAVPLSSPYHQNGNLPVFNVDNTHFPRQELWPYSNPVYRMEEGRKLMSGREGSEAALPRFTTIHGHNYASYRRNTDQEQFVRCTSPRSSYPGRSQATILHTMHLGNASNVIPERKYDSALGSQQAARLPLASSQFPAEVNVQSKRKRQSSILVKEEQKPSRQKDDIKNYQYQHSLGHGNKNTSQIPTAMHSQGVHFTAELPRSPPSPASTVWYNNLDERNSNTKVGTRSHSPVLGMIKDTHHRDIEGGMTARSQSESAEDEPNSSQAVKELSSEYHRRDEFVPHTRPPVIDDESSPRVAQNSGEKNREGQETPHSQSSSTGGLQSVTKRTEQTPAKAKPRHRCDECGQTFTRSSTLTTHKRIHTGEKPYSCEQCGRAFRQLGNLSRHRLTHTTSKPFVCPHCDKAFNRASNLHTHMRTHSDYKPFTCEFCDKRFHQKIDMRIHRYTHTGEKPHKCTKCGRGFKQLTHLTYHLRTHSKEHLYKCDVCGRGFNQKGNLKAHVYRHTGERPFKCDVCSKGFTLASTLNTHKRIHAETKPFQCQFCDKAFYQKNALKTHYVASHPYTGGVLLL